MTERIVQNVPSLRRNAHLGLPAIAGLVAVFLAAWAVAMALGVGVTQVMNWLDAGPNVRVFVGDTLIRGGNLVSQLLLVGLVTRAVLGCRLRDVAFRQHRGWWADLLVGVLLATIAMAFIFAVEVAAGWLVVEGWAWQATSPDAWLRGLWLALLTSTLAAVGEEAMFRGYLLTALSEAWGKWVGLGVMSILFALPHLLVGGAEGTAWPLFTLLLALPGVLLGWAYLRTGSLWLPIGVHFAWNLVQGDLLNLPGRGTMPQGLFGAITRPDGPAWVVGTSYGIEVGLVGILALLVVGAGVWLWTRWRYHPLSSGNDVSITARGADT